MPFLKLDNIEKRNPLPGCSVRFVHTENMTLSYWNLEPGAQIPNHSHHHEQVTTVIEGELEMTVNGKTQRVGPGCVVPIPSNAKHSANALSACYVLDVFYPVREDYL